MTRGTITRLRKEGTLWMIVLYLVLSVMVVIFSVYHIKQQELNTLSRGLYEAGPLTFTIEDEEPAVDWRELDSDKPFTLFVELVGPFRGFYYKEHTYVPPMVSGRFFQEQDFYTGQKLAVVGQEISRTLIEEIQQDGYEIIGTMGASYSSAIDELVLFNIDAVEEGDPTGDVYVLDTSDNTLSAGRSIPFKHTDLAVNEINRADTGVMRFLGTDYFQLMITAFFILLLMSLNLLMIYYWLNQKEIEIRILWQLGIAVARPYQRYALKLLAIASACYWLVGLNSYLWFLPTFPNPQPGMMHMCHLLIGYGLIVLSSGCFMGMIFSKAKQHTAGGGR